MSKGIMLALGLFIGLGYASILKVIDEAQGLRVADHHIPCAGELEFNDAGFTCLWEK